MPFLMDFSVNQSAIRRAMSELGEQTEALRGRIRGAVHEAAEDVRTYSMRLTPVEYGYLRASHRVESETALDAQIRSVVTVGGPSASYAPYVHWGVRSASGKLVFHRPPTQALFLQKAFLEETSAWPGRLVERVREIPAAA